MSETIMKASELRPWLKHYPEQFKQMPVIQCSLEQFIRMFNHKMDEPSLEYYGFQLTMNQIFEMADQTAKAMAAAGVKCGDHLPVFMQFQPEFIFLLLAAEKVGAALICRDGSEEEYIQALHDAKGPVAFVQDFTTKEMEETFYNVCPELKTIVTLNPYTFGKKEEMPEYVIENIEERYEASSIINGGRETTITWDAFYAAGATFEGDYLAPVDPTRSLYHPYTSGSTGPSKEIIHSAATMTGCLCQIAPMMAAVPFKMRCLLPVLPPALIAMVVPIFLLYTSTGHTEILDPYCGIWNHDLELMRLMPNGTVAVSCLGRALLESKRIPADFQFPQLMQIGGGAEASDNKLLDRYKVWLAQHGAVYAKYTMGFGMTEAGPVISSPASFCEFNDLKCGIPLVHNIVGVFDQDGKEIDYHEVGEICVSGPGVMIGYGKENDTKKAIKIHEDGLRWLHTGDYGYLNDEGEITILTRGFAPTWMGGNLYLMVMENKVINLPGIKDCFFCAVPDADHEGYFESYMYLMKEEGADLEQIKAAMKEALDPHEYPVEIREIESRPWFHFKTHRIGLVNGILAERAAAK